LSVTGTTATKPLVIGSKARLEKRGHDVRFDKSVIKAGNCADVLPPEVVKTLGCVPLETGYLHASKKRTRRVC
jgi:hypothetical protein